jgi:hypothetical protein
MWTTKQAWPPHPGHRAPNVRPDRRDASRGEADPSARRRDVVSCASPPDFYIDYGETGPYVAEIGASECAT